MTTGVEPEPTPSWVLTPAMGPDIVMICAEGGLELDEESNEPREDSVWGL